MVTKLIIVSATAALLAATSFASAQVRRDDPPGSAFQDKGMLEDGGFAASAELTGHSASGAYAYGATVQQQRAVTRERSRSRSNAGAAPQNQ
jgi:hypothetical protein